MKPITILPAIFILMISACSHKEKVVEVVDEKPDDVINIPVCETLSPTVMSLFTESRNNQQKYPNLFSGTVQDKIVVTAETDVYVSFVTEGAAIPSTLGWYAYNENEVPSSKDGINKEIVFPNVSNSILNPGDSRRIGKFKPGTVIGFFIIVGGYHNSTVNYSKPTFFTDFAWNENQTKQHVLFKEKKCNDIVMGFEDKQLTTNSDYDYNDMVFIISDNNQNEATTSFDLKTVVIM